MYFVVSFMDPMATEWQTNTGAERNNIVVHFVQSSLICKSYGDQAFYLGKFISCWFEEEELLDLI